MSAQPIRVLLVDDDEDYYVLTRDLLRDIGTGRYALEWQMTFGAGLQAMAAGGHDVCLLDYDLGEQTGLELLCAARQAGSDLPIIMLTGHGDYELDRAAMQAGAADYVTKAGIDATGLERAMRHAMERAQAFRELQERERRIAELYDQEQARSRELEQAYADLRRAEAQREDLVQMIVHDLRGPLSVILSNLGLIERAAHDPSRAEALPHLLMRTQLSARRVVGMVDDMLAVSRLEAGALIPNLRPVNFALLLADKGADYRLQAERSQQVYTEQVAEGLPLVRGDADLLGRVVDNLVANALKYTPPGGHIAVAASHSGDQLHVAVRDDGPGIPREHQCRIFEKYYQVAGDSQAGRKGAGIGLTFCRLAVEAQGGKIWVDPNTEQGSVFRFTLPLAD